MAPATPALAKNGECGSVGIWEMVDEGMPRNVVRMYSVKESGSGRIFIFGHTVCICSGAPAVGHGLTRRQIGWRASAFGAYECVHS